MASKFLNLSTDTTLGGNAPSDEIVASQKALKTYIDAHSGGLNYAGSVAYASLPTPAAGNVGNIYNVTDAFTTDSRFIDGASKAYPAGTNVLVVEDTGTVATAYYGWRDDRRDTNRWTKSATPEVGDTTYYILNGVVEETAIITSVSSGSISAGYFTGDRDSSLDTTISTTSTGYFFDEFMGDISGKQDALVSGTNIKTINGSSILGSGDLTVGGLPSQTGNSGKFLTTDGTDASWATINALQNTATGNYSLTILGTAATAQESINIGAFATCNNRSQISIGYYAAAKGTGSIAIGSGITMTSSAQHVIALGESAYGKNSYCINIGYYAGSASSTSGTPNQVCIGYYAAAKATGAYQFGYGTNSEAGTVCFALTTNSSDWTNYKLLHSDGTIPEARLADTTSAVQGQVLTLDSNLNAVWASASGGASTLSDLTDTTITTPSNGQLLMYNSTTSKWENITNISCGTLAPELVTLTVNITVNGTAASGYTVRFSHDGEEVFRTSTTTTQTIQVEKDSTYSWTCYWSNGQSVPPGSSVSPASGTLNITGDTTLNITANPGYSPPTM